MARDKQLTTPKSSEVHFSLNLSSWRHSLTQSGCVPQELLALVDTHDDTASGSASASAQYINACSISLSTKWWLTSVGSQIRFQMKRAMLPTAGV